MAKKWANMLLVIFSLVIGFVILECGLRIAGISYPSYYTWAKGVGGALRPGAEGLWTKEGRAYIKINSDGLRDREHAKEKPSDAIRIAVLGDSYAEALQVSMKDTFWAVLEKELNLRISEPDKKVEVINFGVSGYGTAQELIVFRQKVRKYDPDIVVLAFLTGNDIRNNSRILERDPCRPYFNYQNGKLILDDSFQSSLTFKTGQKIRGKFSMWLIDHFRVFQVANEARSTLKNWKKARDTEKECGELGLDNQIYHQPQDPVWEDAWKVTEGLLLMMNEEVKNSGAHFMVVTLSNGPQVLPDPGKRNKFARLLGVEDLFYPDRRLENFLTAKEIECLSLAEPFARYAEENQVYLHGFKKSGLGGGHWNENGHRLAGKMIADKLLDTVNAIAAGNEH